MTTETTMTTAPCECGTITEIACAHRDGATTRVRWVPPHLRGAAETLRRPSAHESPELALRLRLHPECVAETLDSEGEWVEVTVREVATPTPDPAEWLVEGAGPDDVWPADDAEDAAGQAAVAQWGDGTTVTWVGTGPAPAVAEFRATWLEAGVEMSKRIVVSRVAS